MKHLFSVLCACVFGPLLTATPLRVVVSIPPQAQWVQAIGGDRVEVSTFLESGSACGAFDPKPSDLARLVRAQLFVLSGAGYEAALLDRFQAQLTGVKQVQLSPPETACPCGQEHDAVGHVHAHDPHTWVSPRRVLTQLAQLRDVLSAADPAGAEVYAAGYAAYAERIRALDAEIAARLRPYAGRAFLVFHPAYGYFATDYGLREIAIQEEGKEPGPRRLQAAIRAAQAEGLRAVLIQPYEAQGSARAVAEAGDGRMVEVDIMAADWEAGMRQLVAVLESILRDSHRSSDTGA